MPHQETQGEGVEDEKDPARDVLKFLSACGAFNNVKDSEVRSSMSS